VGGGCVKVATVLAFSSSLHVIHIITCFLELFILLVESNCLNLIHERNIFYTLSAILEAEQMQRSDALTTLKRLYTAWIKKNEVEVKNSWSFCTPLHVRHHNMIIGDVGTSLCSENFLINVQSNRGMASCSSTAVCDGVWRVAVNRNSAQQWISVHRLFWVLSEDGAISDFDQI
jgi:hypothetical protein